VEESGSGTIDVSGKQRTVRRAVARCRLIVTAEVAEAIRQDKLPKQGAIATARAAGMLAAKRTPDLIPHCHPVGLTSIRLGFEFADTAVTVRCEVTAYDRTGPEMEALCGASLAALTLYDMVKGVCRGAEVADLSLVEKEGGKSGHWSACQETR